MKRVFLFILTCALSMTLMQAQSVSGRVTDSKSGEPIEGVRVIAKDTRSGTSTDADGKYKLGFPSSAEVLKFTYDGKETVEEVINGRSSIEVAMKKEKKPCFLSRRRNNKS